MEVLRRDPSHVDHLPALGGLDPNERAHRRRDSVSDDARESLKPSPPSNILGHRSLTRALRSTKPPHFMGQAARQPFKCPFACGVMNGTGDRARARNGADIDDVSYSAESFRTGLNTFGMRQTH